MSLSALFTDFIKAGFGCWGYSQSFCLLVDYLVIGLMASEFCFRWV
jgi:hypothetical protein